MVQPPDHPIRHWMIINKHNSEVCKLRSCAYIFHQPVNIKLLSHAVSIAHFKTSGKETAAFVPVYNYEIKVSLYLFHLDKLQNAGKILPLWKYIKMKVKSQTHTELVAGQFIDLLQNFIRLHPNLVMPEHVVRFKQQMEKLRGSGNSEDHTFLMRVFIILAQSENPLSMGELSAALKIPLSSATRIVDWLVRGKFLERTYDPKRSPRGACKDDKNRRTILPNSDGLQPKTDRALNGKILAGRTGSITASYE